MQSSRVVFAAVLVFGCLAVKEAAGAGPVKLAPTVRLGSLNNFATGVLDGDCSTTGSFTVPSGQVLAIYDIRCTAGMGLVPPPIQETFWLALVDGAACSGSAAYVATFASVDGLRDSPTLPLVVKDRLTVRVLRTESLNTETVQVSCDFVGVLAVP